MAHLILTQGEMRALWNVVSAHIENCDADPVYDDRDTIVPNKDAEALRALCAHLDDTFAAPACVHLYELPRGNCRACGEMIPASER